MASRSLDDLHPEFRARVDMWLEKCKAAGIDVLVYCTYRSLDEQAALYAIGRTRTGRKVTNARPGSSAHNFRLALDFVPMLNGKAQWANKALYNKAIDIAEACGLQSLRNSSFPELAHLQMPGWRGYVPTN
jgi:peptidoglycan LD-endopeptidase CwlK